MNFRTELEREQQLLEGLLGSRAENLWKEVEVDDILMCDDIDSVKEYITQRIQVAVFDCPIEAIEYLKLNDPKFTRAMNLANDLWETKNLNSELLATLVKQDDLRSEMNDLLIRLGKELF